VFQTQTQGAWRACGSVLSFDPPPLFPRNEAFPRVTQRPRCLTTTPLISPTRTSLPWAERSTISPRGSASSAPPSPGPYSSTSSGPTEQPSSRRRRRHARWRGDNRAGVRVPHQLQHSRPSHTPHLLPFVPWFAIFIMSMVAEIRIGQLNGEARCSYVDADKGPWCTGPGDAVMIGSYIVTGIAFLEG